MWIPDYSYIVDNIDRVKAVLITHGHEGHIGGIPFIEASQCPYLCWTFSACLIRGKIKEHDLLSRCQTHEINQNTELT